MLLEIGQLLTMSGRGVGLVTDGALAVSEGKVAAAGPASAVQERFPNWEQRSAGGRVVTPGLIDAHTHLVFAGDRSDEVDLCSAGLSYAEVAARGGGIQRTVRDTRAAPFEELRRNAQTRADRLLANGTTTLEVKSGYGLNLDAEQRLLAAAAAIRGPSVVPTLLALHAVPPEYLEDRAEWVEVVCEELIPTVAARGLARFVDAFVEDGYFTPDDARRLAHAARANTLGVRLHVDQFTDGGGAALAAELCADSADHLEATGAAGIAALAQAEVPPVLLPGSVLGLGLTRYPNARGMLDAGLPVVLATDLNPGSSPVDSLPLVMALATRQMRMTCAEVFRAVTVNAARSLGLGDRGTLTPGQRADWVAFDATDYREIPTWMGTSLVAEVAIEGKVAYRR